MWESQTLPQPLQQNQQLPPRKHSCTIGVNAGISKAVSLAGPKEIDYKKAMELQEELLLHNAFETEEDHNQRMEILRKLNSLVREWIYKISLKCNMSQNVAEQVGGKVFSSGSFHIDAHHKGADIDTLCVAPRHINRSDFFTSFIELLKIQKEVTDIRAIEKVLSVPLIKMKFDGIEIDMLFASLNLEEIQDSLDLMDDLLLKNLDERCARSMDGCRVANEILKLVPNVEDFRLALRAVKLWAKKHRLYSSPIGYLNGASWAILMARTCQLYPNAIAVTLVHKFFIVFSQWKWPRPVMVKMPVDCNFGLPVWNPRKNVSDRSHLMPIVTPCYPQENLTYNVSQCTLSIIQKELKQGLRIIENIRAGKAKWDKLFTSPNFFGKYKHFIVLSASSASAEDQMLWVYLVESQIHQLLVNLGMNPHIKLAHINPEHFSQLEPDKWCAMWFIGLVFNTKMEIVHVDLTSDFQNFSEIVYRRAALLEILKDGMKIDGRQIKRRQLKAFLPP